MLYKTVHTLQKKKISGVVILCLAAIAFILYSWFPRQTTKDGAYFASPDETANYFWIERFAGGEPLEYVEPLNLIANDAVVPRSVRSDNGMVKPVSFLGIIFIYGWLAKIFGLWIVPFLTPLFAVIGALCFYGIIKKVFDSKVVFWSALMMLAFAPYAYYAARGLFHNVLFVDLLLIGIWLFIYSRGVATHKDVALQRLYGMGIVFLSGIFTGLAVITRVSELIWLFLAVLLAWILYFKQIRWSQQILFLGGIFLALMPMFYYNQILYGGFAQFGYNKPDAAETQNTASINNFDVNNVNMQSAETRYAAPLRKKINNFLPAGINIKQAGKSFINYYVIMFWYLFWPALFGGVWFLWKYKERNKKQRLYFAGFILISVILVLYYGSWEIYDNPDKSSVTIGNSYTRYWLPMYIMSIPLAVMFWQWLIDSLLSQLESREFGTEWRIYIFYKFISFGKLVMTAVIIVFFILNFQAAVLAKEEGLLIMQENLMKDSKLTEDMLSQIEPGAIVISERFDKFFWPERKVIAGNFTDKEHNAQYAKLIGGGVSLYYLGFIFPPEDLDYLNSRRLKDFNLQIEAIKLKEESRLGLYKIKKGD